MTDDDCNYTKQVDKLHNISRHCLSKVIEQLLYLLGVASDHDGDVWSKQMDYYMSKLQNSEYYFDENDYYQYYYNHNNKITQTAGTTTTTTMTATTTTTTY